MDQPWHKILPVGMKGHLSVLDAIAMFYKRKEKIYITLLSVLDRDIHYETMVEEGVREVGAGRKI